MGHLLTGRSLSARRACELGLVNEIVAAICGKSVGCTVGTPGRARSAFAEEREPRREAR